MDGNWWEERCVDYNRKRQPVVALDLAGAQEQWLMLTARLGGRARAKFKLQS